MLPTDMCAIWCGFSILVLLILTNKAGQSHQLCTALLRPDKQNQYPVLDVSFLCWILRGVLGRYANPSIRSIQCPCLIGPGTGFRQSKFQTRAFAAQPRHAILICLHPSHSQCVLLCVFCRGPIATRLTLKGNNSGTFGGFRNTDDIRDTVKWLKSQPWYTHPCLAIVTNWAGGREEGHLHPHPSFLTGTPPQDPNVQAPNLIQG